MCLWLGLGQMDGWTPLHTASLHGHVEVVEALVKAGASLNQATVCDCMPVLLVECGVHVCLWDDAHRRTCSEHCGETCMCVYPWLGLGQTGGATPLFIASENGHVEVVEVLVKAKVALNQAMVCDCIPSCAAGRVWCARVSLGRRKQVGMLSAVGARRACGCVYGLGWGRTMVQPRCSSPARRVTLRWWRRW